MHGTYVGNNRMLVLPAWGTKLFTPADDLSLTPPLLIDGCIEVGLTNYLINSIGQSLRGKTVIDVGANLGYFTVLLGCLVGKEGKVIAYEPNPFMYKNFLLDNIYINETQTQVVPINKAVSHKEEELNFHVSERYRGNSSFVNHPEAYFNQFATDVTKTIPVQAEPLDIYFDMVDQIDLVKIDVEGAELNVFHSMPKLIDGKKVKRIVFEINKNMLQENVSPLYQEVKSLVDHGYQIYRFNPNGSTVASSVDEVFSYDYLDNILLAL